MQKIKYDGVEGVFYTNKEFQLLRDKIITQQEYINELLAEEGGQNEGS